MCAAAITKELSRTYPGVEVVSCPSWMQAARYLGRASAVVIDWALPDGVSAVSCGAIDRLKRAGIPYMIWTANPADVPPGTGTVITKGDAGGLAEAIESLRSSVIA